MAKWEGASEGRHPVNWREKERSTFCFCCILVDRAISHNNSLIGLT